MTRRVTAWLPPRAGPAQAGLWPEWDQPSDTRTPEPQNFLTPVPVVFPTPEPQSKLTIVPITLHQANAYVKQYHRHHGRARGCRFCIAVVDEAGVMRGVAIVGRPVARRLDDGLVAEVLRLATDGCPNACSALYGAAWRAARAQGFRRLVTYILASEPGTSLKAAGWRMVGDAGGGSWSRAGRSRTDRHPLERKVRWEVTHG